MSILNAYLGALLCQVKAITLLMLYGPGSKFTKLLKVSYKNLKNYSQEVL